MNSTHFLAISSLAIGFVTTISATSANAVTIAPGSRLAFNDGLLNTSGTVNATTLGNTFQGTFTENGSGTVSTASGTFASLLAGLGPTTTSLGAKFITSNPVIFEQVGFSATIPGGIDYLPTTALTFDFGSAGTLTVPANTRFLVTSATSTGAGSRSDFDIYTTPRFGGTFTNGGDITNIDITSFSFDVDNFDRNNPLNTSPNGSFSLVATVPTAVPEPFSIVGTILGGTAAMRMRKKLAQK